MNRDRFLFEAAKINPTQNFLKLHGYKSEYGQEIFASIVFNVPYIKALQESIAALKGYFPQDPHFASVKIEVLGSLKENLLRLPEAKETENEQDFLPFWDEKRRKIDGIKLHRATSELHIFSFVHKKIISQYGNPYGKKIPRFNPIRESFKKLCPALKFEKLRVSPWQVENITVENLALLEF
jgi:hypothetical protein